MSWSSTVYAATPGDVPLTLVPNWIKRICVPVAWGTGPPKQPLPADWLAQARARFDIYGWAWCQGPNPEAEAAAHAAAAKKYAVKAFAANMEEQYDAHGNSADPRYQMPGRYLAALRAAGWTGPVAVTTTSGFGSDMTAWINGGALVQPQAFTLEVPIATLAACVAHARAWGWPVAQIRPLLQAYPTNGKRPDPVALNAAAVSLGVGGIPYTVEQAMDEPGQAWLATMQPTVEWPLDSYHPPPEEPDPAELVERLQVTATNVDIEMELASATDPERWIEQNPKEFQEIGRLAVYRAFGRDRAVVELRTHRGRAASGIVQNGVLAQNELGQPSD